MARKKNSRARGRGRKEKKVFPQVEGRVQMTREGFAFVIVEGEDDDVFVKSSKTRGALNGDIVRVTVTREKTDKDAKAKWWRFCSVRPNHSLVFFILWESRLGCLCRAVSCLMI